MPPSLEVSLFPARHLQDDVYGKHEAQLYFQLVEIMFDWLSFVFKHINLIQMQTKDSGKDCLLHKGSESDTQWHFSLHVRCCLESSVYLILFFPFPAAVSTAPVCWDAFTTFTLSLFGWIKRLSEGCMRNILRLFKPDNVATLSLRRIKLLAENEVVWLLVKQIMSGCKADRRDEAAGQVNTRPQRAYKNVTSKGRALPCVSAPPRSCWQSVGGLEECEVSMEAEQSHLERGMWFGNAPCNTPELQ